MSAVLTKALADLRRRRLQGAVILVVILLTSLATTLALNLLLETDAPYDHAFKAANAAHLSLTFHGDQATSAQLQASASAAPVVAVAGPWPVAQAVVTPHASPLSSGKSSPSGPAAGGSLKGMTNFIGRPQPDTTVDRLALDSGRWPRQLGEVVLSRSLARRIEQGVGSAISVEGAGGPVTLTVVGIADSISPGIEGEGAWVLPEQIPALEPSSASPDLLMLYRVSPAATATDLQSAAQAITKGLPPNAVADSANYLDAKHDADRKNAVMIPFLVAFSLFALISSTVIIANIVSGAVIASYREIGIMKAIGMTPRQVVAILMLQVLVPAAAGCALGIPLGTLLSQPFLRDAAQALGLPASFVAPVPVIAGVLVLILSIGGLAALGSAWRAGRLSAVAAITLGSAPPSGGSRLGRLTSRLPLPRAWSLGLGDTFARPLRSLMTTAAIVLGVATLVFAPGLDRSLNRVAAAFTRVSAVQVTVGNAPFTGVTDSQISTLIQRDPGTAAVAAEATVDAAVPGIAGRVPFTAYRGSSAWTGYELIAGRWFTGPSEVVAPAALIDRAHLTLGQRFQAEIEGRSVALTLVGEIFDQELALRGDWSTLVEVNPSVQPTDYEIHLRPGVSPEEYASRLGDASGLFVRLTSRSDANATLVLLITVISGLALVLVSIAALGVFNTVVLATRERAREIAILKAVGMAPRQVVSMVVGAVVLLGIAGGVAGVPVGLLLHHRILTLMGRIASDTPVPSHIYDVFSPLILVLLVLSGALVAAIGALLPAIWAARSSVAERLQAE